LGPLLEAGTTLAVSMTVEPAPSVVVALWVVTVASTTLGPDLMTVVEVRTRATGVRIPVV
jgi:hypothetical protein